MEKVDVERDPEKMLLTLYNRASEASRVDGYIKDDLCVKIRETIKNKQAQIDVQNLLNF